MNWVCCIKLDAGIAYIPEIHLCCLDWTWNLKPIKATDRKRCYPAQSLSCTCLLKKICCQKGKKRKNKRYIHFQKAMKSCKGIKYRHRLKIMFLFHFEFCGLFKWGLPVWLFFLAGFTGKQVSNFQRWTKVVFSTGSGSYWAAW